MGAENSIADVYGGRRAFALHLRSRTAAALGLYAPFGGGAAGQSGRLVFVCKGNICRSAYAEAFATQRGLTATSAGLDGDPGKPANPMAASVASTRGVSLSAHRARRLVATAIRDDDLVVVFEPGHARALRRMLPTRRGGVCLLGMLMTPCFPHIQDPYGRSSLYFEQCFARIENGIMALEALLHPR